MDFSNIITRFDRLTGGCKVERSSLQQDLELADSCFDMDWEGLASAEDGAFLQDIQGIQTYANRDTKKIGHNFHPAFSRGAPKPPAPAEEHRSSTPAEPSPEPAKKKAARKRAKKPTS